MKLELSDRKIVIWLFVAILSASVGLKIYKAHSTGIIYDEAFTFANFGQNVHDALNLYVNPNNNHVINSILICWAYKFFGSYEHFIRIPSAIAGVIVSLALGYIVFKVIGNNALKVVMAGFVTMHYFVFDLSFLARGYSFALAAILAGTAVIIKLFEDKIPYRKWLIPAITVALINFIAFGSMLSSLWTLIGLNAVFILFFSHRVFKDSPKRVYCIAVNTVAIGILSFLSLYALYFNLYKQILASTGKFGKAPFLTYLNLLLVETTLHFDSVYCKAASYMFLVLLAGAVVFFVIKTARKEKSGKSNAALGLTDGQKFIILTALGTMLAMFFHSVILDKAIGYPRNGVFLVPFVLISFGIFFDKCLVLVTRQALRNYAAAVIVFVAGFLGATNVPRSWRSVYVHDWDVQCASGPLLHHLKGIDSQKAWKIALSPECRYLSWPLVYYRQFGYRFEFVPPEDCDIAMFYVTEDPPVVTYLDRAFFEQFRCIAAVKCDLPWDKVFLDARLR